MPYVYEEFPIKTPIKAYRFLIQQFNLSMPQAQSYISKGRVQYQGETLQDKAKVLCDCVRVLVFKPNSTGLKPLFENEDFAIFNKPPKMLIHPKGRFVHQSFMDEVRAHLGGGANLIHRIDKETSGLVLVGKHKASIVQLGEMFLQNRIQKEYLAITRAKRRITQSYAFGLSLPIATQQKGGDLCVRSVCWDPKSLLAFKSAQSDFELLGVLDFDVTQAKKDLKYLLIKVLPKTGRTHQIRVHLAALGIPILGDPLYGTQDSYSREYLGGEFLGGSSYALSAQKRLEYFGATRLMLHAYGLRFCYRGEEFYLRSRENFDISSGALGFS